MTIEQTNRLTICLLSVCVALYVVIIIHYVRTGKYVGWGHL